MPITQAAMEARARNLRLLLFDVDGVLTDGTVQISGAGPESKAFFIRDGAALVWAQQSGLGVGLLSGRSSEATTRRAEELGISLVVQGQLEKRVAFQQIVAAQGVRDDQVGYMGDDLLDLPVLARVGLSAAPADAVPEVRERVHFVTAAPGGHGAVREFIEIILRGRGRWEDLVRTFR